MPRLSVQFSASLNKMLKELAKEKGTTKTEILRRALATYKYLDDETKDGDSRIAIRSTKDNSIKDVVLL